MIYHICSSINNVYKSFSK